MTKRLSQSQKEKLLAWISEGLHTDEINRRASQCRPPFEVSRQQVDYYRGASQTCLSELEATSQHAALRAGLARREERVERLKALAARMEADLFGERLWVKDVKAVGSGDAQIIVDFETFNAAEVREYRAVLDDLARELGHRKQKVEVGSDPHQPLKVIVEYAGDSSETA